MSVNWRRLALLATVGFLLAASFACSGGEEPTATTSQGSNPTATASSGATQTAPTATSQPQSTGVAPQPDNPSGTLTMSLVNLTGSPGSLPDLPMFPARQAGVGESLFYPQGNDWGTPMLAESWELATDLSGVTIRLREGVRFHGDWGELTAEDMAWVINRTNPSLNPESIAASAANFSALFGDTAVEAVDRYTIRATFNTFDVRWASNLLNQEASGGLTSIATSKKAFDEMGVDWMRANFVGTGPFQVVEHTEDISGTYEKVPYDHWRKNASIDQLTLIAVAEEATRMAMLQSGEIDLAFIDPKDHAEVARRGFVAYDAGRSTQEGVFFPGNLWETTNALTGESINYGGIYVNDLPWIGNPFTPNDSNNPSGIDDMEQARLVRQAIARSVNRDEIIEFVLGGVGMPVHVEWFSVSNPLWNSQYEFPYDPEMAEELLDQAGYPRGSGGVRFEMPLFVGPELGGGEGPAGEIGDAISGYWSEVGIRPQVLKYAYAVFRPGLVGRGTATPFLTSCDDGNDAYPWDWPKGLVMTTLTRGGFSCGNESPELLEWYQQAATEPDVQERININNQVLGYLHNWALNPGYVSVPTAYFGNPKSLSAWDMHLGNSFNSPENIVPAR